MSFVGQANRFGDTLGAAARPRSSLLTPNGTTREAMVERIVHLGFEVRVELARDDGEHVHGAADARTRPSGSSSSRGQIVYVEPTRETTFA